MKPIKSSVAFVVWNETNDRVLSVQRPANDENLPNVWGLPAGSLREGETFEDSVLRSGKEKLGTQLEIVKLLVEGDIERERYVLHMKEFEARIISGTPVVPQNVAEVTQYQNWKWAEPKLMVEAAQKGSLCSRLFLNRLGIPF